MNFKKKDSYKQDSIRNKNIKSQFSRISILNVFKTSLYTKNRGIQLTKAIAEKVSKALDFSWKRIKSGAKKLMVYSLLLLFLFNLGFISDSLGKLTRINKESWLEFFGALLGAGIAVWGANYLTELKEKKEKDKKEQIAVKIIMQFLWREVENNYELLLEWQKSKSSELNLVFREYYAVRYDFIKYDAKVISDILDLYGMMIDLAESTKDYILLYVLSDGHIEKITKKRDEIINQVDKYRNKK